MFKQLLSDKRIFGAIVCVIVFVAGGLLYLNAVKQKAARDVQRTQETITQLQTPKTEAQPQNPIVSETEHGHTHADGTFHAQPHDVPVDRPVLPPLEAPAKPQETPKFVKPAPDTQHITIAEQVAASGDVPDRSTLEAMTDEQLRELSVTSSEKTRELSPQKNNAIREWAKTVNDLTRHAKTREERDAILAQHADTVRPLEDAMDEILHEYFVHQQTGRRASKVLNARQIVRFSKPSPDRRLMVVPESLTDEFWATYWSDF